MATRIRATKKIGTKMRINGFTVTLLLALVFSSAFQQAAYAQTKRGDIGDVEPESGPFQGDFAYRYAIASKLFSDTKDVLRLCGMVVDPTMKVEKQTMFVEEDLKNNAFRVVVRRGRIAVGKNGMNRPATIQGAKGRIGDAVAQPKVGTDLSVSEEAPIAGAEAKVILAVWERVLKRARYSHASELSDGLAYHFFVQGSGRDFSGQSRNPAADSISGKLADIGDLMIRFVQTKGTVREKNRADMIEASRQLVAFIDVVEKG
jgi:hypothetical protein